MTANETTLSQKLNDTKINNYMDGPFNNEQSPSYQNRTRFK